MMTKKHFERLAASIKTVADVQTRLALAKEVARDCADSNPRFDEARFFMACGVLDAFLSENGAL